MLQDFVIERIIQQKFVLAACSFDLKFTYFLPGWEGSASDSRIIKNALTSEDNLKILTGNIRLLAFQLSFLRNKTYRIH